PSGMITTYDDVEINTANYFLEVECLLDPTEITANGALDICPGSTLELEAVEGYDSYTWSNGDDGQTTEISEAGTYSVILWDDECASISNTVTVSVLTDETPEISLEGEPIVCFGEEVILTASNGENFSWSNDETQQSILVTETGDYFVMIDALCSDDQLTSETISVTVLDAANAPVVADMEIGTPGSVDLTATGNNIMWYAGEFDNDAIAEGDTYSTPVVNDTYTVWAEANVLYPGDAQEGGMEVADYLLNGGLPSTGAYNYFDAYEFFTIETVEVNVPEDGDAGVRTIQLVDNNGVVLEETTFDLAAGTHTLELNFDVPAGTQYSLRCPENNLFRSSGGVSYPYAIGSVGSITDSFYGGTYYYYFYNWEVKTQEWMCPSDRVEVTVNVVSVNEIEELASLSVYPNPAADVLSVEMELTQSSAVVLTLSDIAGRTVHTEQANILGSSRISIPVEQLQAGVYTLAIQINGQQVVRKIIVE
ncbi:MAG: T9SS type A sorting domain-containing protein, partial [Flavobacteriales bacterium]